MKYGRQVIPLAGLAATVAVAAYMVVQLSGQTSAVTADFTSAARAEVRDAQGQVLLSGAFQPVQEDDDDVERKAVLAPAGPDPDAAGEAEVEFARTKPANQEVEFSVHNLAPGTVVTFVVDGTEVGTATVDTRGRAEIELEVRAPAAGGR